jgi:hypothetical protein
LRSMYADWATGTIFTVAWVIALVLPATIYLLFITSR